MDLSETDYVFSEGSKATVWGAAPKMQVKVDGEVLKSVYGAGSKYEESVEIPPGAKIVEAVCGGWCGNCWALFFLALSCEWYSLLFPPPRSALPPQQNRQGFVGIGPSSGHSYLDIGLCEGELTSF